MCGRYTTEIETDERELFRMLARAEANTNSGSAVSMTSGKPLVREVFPSEPAAVLTADAGGGIDVHLFRWGYPTEIAGKRRLLINARSETAAEKPMFSDGLLYRRCVIPTAGFFEWAHVGGRADTDRKYRFNLPHTGILYLAGFFRPSYTAAGTCEFLILTREANVSMAPIHDRMPVIVREEHIAEYLADAAAARQLLYETPPMLLKKLVS